MAPASDCAGFVPFRYAQLLMSPPPHLRTENPLDGKGLPTAQVQEATLVTVSAIGCSSNMHVDADALNRARRRDVPSSKRRGRERSATPQPVEPIGGRQHLSEIGAALALRSSGDFFKAARTNVPFRLREALVW